MVGIGTGCFIQLPGNTKQRVLHPTEVVGFADGIHTVSYKYNSLPVGSEMDLLVYYEKNREFMQQSARIEGVNTVDVEEAGSEDAGAEEGGPQLHISFKTTGEPVSAESRQHYRVSTIITGYQANLNDEKACRVLDVSSTGLAVVSEEEYAIGNVVEVSIGECGRAYSGSVCVQSVRDLGAGQTRYGLHCVSDARAQGALPDGLQKANMRMQREQLRRLAGSA